MRVSDRRHQRFETTYVSAGRQLSAKQSPVSGSRPHALANLLFAVKTAGPRPIAMEQRWLAWVKCIQGAFELPRHVQWAAAFSRHSPGSVLRRSSHFASAALSNGGSWGKCDPNKEADYVQSRGNADRPSGNRRSG